MAHVENADTVAHCGMLIVDAGIRNGHIVAGKRRHLSAKGNVFLGERRRFHIADWRQIYEISSHGAGRKVGELINPATLRTATCDLI
jgi:hypothetical protein